MGNCCTFCLWDGFRAWSILTLVAACALILSDVVLAQSSGSDDAAAKLKRMIEQLDRIEAEQPITPPGKSDVNPDTSVVRQNPLAAQPSPVTSDAPQASGAELPIHAEEKRDREQVQPEVSGPASPLPSAAPSPEQIKLELAFWESIKESKDASLYHAYLKRFPNGTFVAVAEARIASLNGGTARADTNSPNQNRPVQDAPQLTGSASNLDSGEGADRGGNLTWQPGMVKRYAPLANTVLPKLLIFPDPKYQGYWVDQCRSWGKDCGRPAADAFCRKMGFANSSESKWSYRAPTRVITTGQICKDAKRCGGFSRIVCVR